MAHKLGGDRYPERNRYRDVVMLVAIGLVLAGVWVATKADQHAGRATREAATANGHAEVALTRVQSGRRTSLALTCAVLSAVAEAGRQVIVGSTSAPETPFTRALERLGYPPRSVRIMQAREAGALYVQHIDQRVEDELAALGERVSAKALINPDGTINCTTLGALSDVRVVPPVKAPPVPLPPTLPPATSSRIRAR